MASRYNDDEEDDALERRRRQRSSGLRDTLRILNGMAWGLMMLGTVVACLLYLFGVTRKEPGNEFFGIIALSCAVIVMYVLARGVEKITGAIAEFIEPDRPRR